MYPVPPQGWVGPTQQGLFRSKPKAWNTLTPNEQESAYSAAQSKRILDKFKEKYVEELKQTLPDYVIVKFPIGPDAADPWDQDEVVNKAVPEVPDDWDGDVTNLPKKVPAPPSSEAQAHAAATVLGGENDPVGKSRLIKTLLYFPDIQMYRNERISGKLGDLDSTAGGKRNLRDNSNPFTYTIDGNKRFNKLLELFYGGIKTQECNIPESAVYRYCQKTIPDDTLLTSFITNNIIPNFAPPKEICEKLAEAEAKQAAAVAGGGVGAPAGAPLAPGGGGGPDPLVGPDPLGPGGAAVGGRRNATRRKAKRNQKARRRTR